LPQQLAPFPHHCTGAVSRAVFTAKRNPSPFSANSFVFAQGEGSGWDALIKESKDLGGQGEYEHAAVVAQKALEVAEQYGGPEHPYVGQSLYNLAVLYLDTYDAKAEPLFKRSLAITEKALGPDHPDVATSLNNLAELYKILGDYAKAESLYQRALAIWEKAYGPDHPGLGQSLNNLASLYLETYDAKAEPLFKRSLAIREKAYGPDHPDVADSLDWLAKLYRITNRIPQAEKLEQRAAKIRAIER
jgi:tetratricopeptide (TPR) repeat protein